MGWKKFVRVAAVAVLVYLGFRYLLPWLLPFLAAFLVVKLIRGWVRIAGRYLHMKKIPAQVFLGLCILALALFCAYRLILCVSEQGIRLAGYCRENYPDWQASFEVACSQCDELLGLAGGTLHGFLMNGISDVFAQFTGFLTEWFPEQLVRAAAACAGVFVSMAIIGMASLLLYRDYEGIVAELRRQHWYPGLRRIYRSVERTALVYLKAEGTILFLVIIFNWAGLALLGYTGTFFLAVAIGLVDFLPVLGAGTVLLPWTFVLLLQGSYGQAAGLFVIYLLCSLTRQYLEPRLMGAKIGLRPFYMLACIYFGVRLFGIWGVFLGPLAVSLVMAVNKEWGGAV